VARVYVELTVLWDNAFLLLKPSNHVRCSARHYRVMR
jgi:hypothetical protein